MNLGKRPANSVMAIGLAPEGPANFQERNINESA